MAKPYQIAVTGGKGGTGKSTVSILLWQKLLREGKKVLLCDADVECPNDYLLLGGKKGKLQRPFYTHYPKLIKEKCRKCGLCVKACRNHAIFQAPGQYPVFVKDLCSGCGACQLACPFGAIKMEKEVAGGIYLQDMPSLGFLITGVAKAGLEETGPLVEDLKKFARDFAKKNHIDTIIIDTAAGTHCPVLHALVGSDEAYVVTEPTPMGAHDLALILDILQKMKLPFSVILNQADLGDRKLIEKVVKKYHSTIAKEIPFSQDLLEAYSQGRLGEVNFHVL